MKTQESITKKYTISKDIVVTVKSDPVKVDGITETYKNTVTIKRIVEKLEPMSFNDNDEISEFVKSTDFTDPQQKLFEDKGQENE